MPGVRPFSTVLFRIVVLETLPKPATLTPPVPVIVLFAMRLSSDGKLSPPFPSATRTASPSSVVKSESSTFELFVSSKSTPPPRSLKVPFVTVISVDSTASTPTAPDICSNVEFAIVLCRTRS